MATFAEILGTKLSFSEGEDSISLVPLLRGEDQPVRDHEVSCSASGVPALRQGPWKLILASGSGGWSRGGDETQPVQLYNLADDIGETHNLAATQPARVAAMAARSSSGSSRPAAVRPGAPQKNDVKVRRYPVVASAVASVPGTAALRLDSPLDYQVVQRRTHGGGDRARERPRAGGYRDGRDPVRRELGSDRVPQGRRQVRCRCERPGRRLACLPARASAGGKVLATAKVAHIGVGEVFVVAGQSNSANHGEERQATATGRVAAFDGRRWQLARDPQPGASGDGGSFLPPFGDRIAELFGVPVGLVACGIGATSVREWLPEGVQFPNPPTLVGRVRQVPGGEWESRGEAFAMLTARMKPLGPHGFRAVLWHQGESDANQKDPARTLPGRLYRQYLERLIRDSRGAIGWERRGSSRRSAITCRATRPRPTSARPRGRSGSRVSRSRGRTATRSRAGSAIRMVRGFTSAAQGSASTPPAGRRRSRRGWNLNSI